jgi:hypothetical protein
MPQITTTVPSKFSGDTLTADELNNVISTVQNNSQNAESRLTASESSYTSSASIVSDIEQVHINNIQTYTIANLPVLNVNGTPAFSSEMQRPIYFKDGEWYRIYDDFRMNDATLVDMFITMGQSNADGKADFSALDPALAGLNRSGILNYSSSVDSGDKSVILGEWEVMNPGVNTAAQGGKFGPEVGFADTVKAIVDGGGDSNYSTPVAMMKFAKGSTSLAEDWSHTYINNYMYKGMEKALPDSREKLIDNGKVFNIRGVIWYQGESDSQDQAEANSYEANLTAFIGDVRTQLGIPTLPFIIVKVGVQSSELTNFPYIATVRQASQDVADDDVYIKTLDALDYTFRSDGVHLNAAGQYQLGIDIVSKFRELI